MLQQSAHERSSLAGGLRALRKEMAFLEDPSGGRIAMRDVVDASVDLVHPFEESEQS